MKAITVLQPFATLIALGEKHFETRSWKTDYRGELLIHAGKGTQYMYLCNGEPFKSVLGKYGYKDNLPIGQIIAITRLQECYKIYNLDEAFKLADKINNPNEMNFGDWNIGRYVWKLGDIQILKEPISVKGQQRLWNYRGEIIG